MHYIALALSVVGLMTIGLGWFGGMVPGSDHSKATSHSLMVYGIFMIMISAIIGLLYLALV